MQFISSQSELVQYLGYVGKFIPNRATHPILSHVLITIKESKVSFTGYDLSTGLRVDFDANVLGKGSFTVPFSLFFGIISKLDSNSNVEINAIPDDESEGIKVNIKTDNSEFSLMGSKSDEYPNLIIDLVDSTSLELSANTISKGLELCLYSASNDDTKQILTGVRLEANENSEIITFASTDGHRLTVADFVTNNQLPEIKLTIPKSALIKLAALLKNTEENVSVSYSDSLCLFTANNWIFASRILEGRYPDYRNLIPSSFSGEFFISRKELLNSLNRASIFCNDKKNIVNFEINGYVLRIFTNDNDLGSSEETLTIGQVTASDITFAGNIKYLIECLKSLDDFNQIALSYNTPLSPFIIVPNQNQEDKSTENLKQLISLLMPIQIKKY